MIAINFYNFTKRPNSTKQPGSPSASYQALIWEGSSLDQPVLKMQIPRPVGGYCQIPDYGRYYFVRDWKFEGGFWWAYLDVDVLANGRTQIMSSTQYIARSSVGYNTYIIDGSRPSEAKSVSRTAEVELLPNVGSVIVAVAGVGGAKLYAMTVPAFYNLTQWMFTQKQDTLWETIVAATAQNFVKTFVNPFQYILGSYTIGFDFSPTASDPVTIGYWNTGVGGHAWSMGAVTKKTVNLSVPKHPNASGLKNYLVASPYSSYTLTLPGIGTHAIPAIRLWDVSTLTINVTAGIDGSIEYEVRTPSNILGVYTTAIRSEMPFSSAVPDIFSAVGSIAGGTVGSVKGNVAGLVGSVFDAASSLIPDVNSTGGLGGKAATLHGNRSIQICGTFFDVTPGALDINGAPRYSTGTLGTAGFYQIIDPQVYWCETEAEANKTISLMEGGIYVE